jgi:histidine ammonia-lyase
MAGSILFDPSSYEVETIRPGVAVIEIHGTRLTADQVVELSAGGVTVAVTDDALERVAASQRFAAEAVTVREIYGRSTGVGANRNQVLADPEAQAVGLLRSHATAAGDLRAPERVRAMLVVRLNQLALGVSGADPAVLHALTDMINRDALPPVRELGSLGTGDLPALAVTALALRGDVVTSKPIGEPVEFGPGDALPFLSSNAATIADALLAAARLRTVAQAALVVAAASYLAVDGNSEAFAAAVEQATPFEGARLVCATMRRLVAGSPTARRIQDPFALRTLPQVHGALLDALDRLESVAVLLANAASENPVLSPEHGIAHHGGFHVAYLAQALDLATLATAQAAQLSLARLTMLSEPAITGRPSFLGDGTAGASGIMMAEYTAAGALAELRALATPASLQTVTLSRGVEEDASFASLGARQALDSVQAYRTVVAAELLAAVRCLRQRGLSPEPLAGLLAACTGLSTDHADRNLTSDLVLAQSLVDGLAQIMSSSGRSSSA